jgi:hypothetical protein
MSDVIMTSENKETNGCMFLSNCLQKNWNNFLFFSSVTQLLKAKPVHLDFFEYELVNKDFCGNDDPDIDLLIFIISKSRSYERRTAIRRTYGNLRNVYRYIHNTLNIRILFWLIWMKIEWRVFDLNKIYSMILFK